MKREIVDPLPTSRKSRNVLHATYPTVEELIPGPPLDIIKGAVVIQNTSMNLIMTPINNMGAIRGRVTYLNFTHLVRASMLAAL